ncbi:Bromodomain-containing protein [Aureobasidium sp. EXF-10728]|nr:Bromodomain-containing protein [Aureobasidium sp. EXF-10728]
MSHDALAQHTPLESLLLLHALRSDSLTAIHFGQISEQLKNIPLIRNDPTYDGARLHEDALKHLCLRLLKDEARNSLDQHDDRKKRQLSPTIPTIEEAAKHSHLIPRLVHRLYTRYRDGVVAEIRDEEEKYDTLTREIVEIENGKWDDRLRSEQPATTAVSTRPSSTDATPAPPAADVTPQPNRPVGAPSPAVKEPAKANRAKIDAVINHEPIAARATASPTPPLLPSSQSQYAPPAVPHRLSTTSLPPLSEMAPDSPLPQHTQHSQPSPQLPNLQAAPPYRLSPVIQQNGLPPQFARPNVNPSPRHSPAPSSPRPVLPLPPGMSMPPRPHSPAVSTRGGPAQYPSPTQRLPPVPLQPATRAPHANTPPAYQQAYPPYPQQPVHPNQQQPPYPPRPPHQGGYQLPPFQVTAQDPSRMHQHQLAQQQVASQHARQPPTPARQQVPAPYSPHTPYAYPAPADPRRPDINALDILSSLRKTPRATLSRSMTPRSNSRAATWKRERPSLLSRPFIDGVESPVPERVSPPPSAREASPVRTTKEIPIKPKPIEGQPSQTEEAEAEPTPKPLQSTRKSTRRNRAISNASSAIASSVRARTRSQSVLSQAEGQTANVEHPIMSRIVKDEPMTPAEMLQEEILQAETSDPPSQLRSKRSRASTNKRKRARSATPIPSSEAPAAESSEPEATGPAYGPPLKTKVQAHRNFARISNVIINDITQHKHAGPFQKPVREKDAEGYTTIIKRPQDLKSIKAAITFGSRAINTATASLDSPAATPSSNFASLVLLDKTSDLIPPKAIVNSSQLEKEVMRMFANAVMFNPGMEGMVQDAREMADDIEAKVRDWRQVEGAAANVRAAADREDDEDAVAGLPTQDKKRRKV